MNNFWTRLVTGAVFVSVIMGCIWWNFWSMVGLFLFISFLGLWEFYSLLEKASFHPQKYFGIMSGMLFFLSPLVANNILFMIISIFVCFVLFFIELFRNKAHPFSNIGFTLLGIIYIVVPFLLLSVASLDSASSDISYSPENLIGFFLLIWANDTFAYLVGRAMGKTKLFERISPKKTWEGTIGGIICAQGIAYIISIFSSELTLIQWMILSLIVSVFGTLGDLVESMFKRSLGVKDSGNILPGHGGILDRFDAVFLSAPFVVAYLIIIR